jgi:flagellum-specific ATP synthase
MIAWQQHLERIMPAGLVGQVARTEGLMVAASGFPAPLGALATIHRETGDALEAEVVGFREGHTLLFPYQPMHGLRRGNRVELRRTTQTIQVSRNLLGRVLNAQGKPIDGRPLAASSQRMQVDQSPPSAINRPRIDTPLSTGVRAIDGMLTCGSGQRLGIFAGSGVGKSSLLGMMARSASADVNVICLVGERGREVNEFIERDLGPAGLQRSVVVVATSDEPALCRVRAALAATTIAEWFRDEGNNVLMMMDSVTRFAIAQREIGLAAGEPPTTRGYPPSVFAMMPRLLERTGMSERGSITAFYTVLVEGDDANEPISDAVRGYLDGHIMLSRALATKNHYPAIDVLESISRLLPEVTSAEHRDAIAVVRRLLATYRENEDLITIGAYRAGSSKDVDLAIAVRDDINAFLRQDLAEPCTVEAATDRLLEVVQKSLEAQNKPTTTPSKQLPVQPQARS